MKELSLEFTQFKYFLAAMFDGDSSNWIILGQKKIKRLIENNWTHIVAWKIKSLQVKNDESMEVQNPFFFLV